MSRIVRWTEPDPQKAVHCEEDVRHPTAFCLDVVANSLIQPSYLWENSKGARDINHLLFGLIVNLR
jgi:hypothetical protein